MELYCREVTLFDEQLMNDFLLEHQQNSENDIGGDGSLILEQNYSQYDHFYHWFQAIERLNREFRLKRGQVGCTVYLVLSKKEDQLIGLFDIRHSLNYKYGSIYGHLGVDIRPSERGKGYYHDVLELALHEMKQFSLDPIVISCQYDNIVSKRGIEHLFGSDPELIPCEGTYFFVYKKSGRRNEV